MHRSGGYPDPIGENELSSVVNAPQPPTTEASTFCPHMLAVVNKSVALVFAALARGPTADLANKRRPRPYRLASWSKDIGGTCHRVAAAIAPCHLLGY